MEAIRPGLHQSLLEAPTIGALVHSPLTRCQYRELVQRASFGPIPGELMLLAGVIFSAGWIGFAAITYFLDRANGPRPRVTTG